MQCLNHPEVEAKSFCQNCGKPLCAQCVRTTPSGHILCEQCLLTAPPDANQAFWQAAQAYVTSASGVPNPSAAAVLGLIPGVGAMYNGQLFKGLIHVVIFAVLISMTENYGVFGIFIGAWVLYQSFEAFQTAKARRDGLPLPDPFGLNELGGWLNLGGPRSQRPQSGPSAPPPASPGPVPGQNPAVDPNTNPGANPAANPDPAQEAAASAPPYGAPYTPPYTQAPYTPPYAGGWGTNPTPGYTTPPYNEPYPGANPDPYAGGYPPGNYPPGSYPPGNYPPGSYPPGYIPPVPPIPPMPPYSRGWRGREPAWAVILIVLGLVFLLKTVGMVSHLFHFAWPVLLIGFGVWMIVRRVGNTQGGPK
jgi:hypothetical protein